MSMLAKTSDSAAERPAVTGWKAAVSKFLGIFTVTPEPWNDNAKAWGGHLAPPPQSITRWYLADLEAALHEADLGDLSRFARLCRAMGRDGTLKGVERSRTGGLVRLPKRFTGNAKMVAALVGRKGRRGIFDLMFPAPELAALVADGIKMGVGVAELLPVEGRAYPVLRRLNPEYLIYRWSENRWYYRSIGGLLAITPGDGRWILHLPGGESEPWTNALGWALGRAWITKDHAFHYRSNFESKLANPARVAYMPNGASEGQRQGFFERLMAWGVNTVFALLPGWEVKLLESNGRGYEVFLQTIQKCDEEIIIALGSSPVLITGGTGFANADVHKSIRADVIQDDAEGLAHTINTQGIPPWVNVTYGGDALDEAPMVAWDVTPPKDLKSEAESLSAAAKALVDLRAAYEPTGKEIDDERHAVQFAIPIKGDVDGDARPDVEDEDDAPPESGVDVDWDLEEAA
jgi:hypothetical protein